MVEEVKLPPGLKQREGVWYYRKRVPTDLVSHFCRAEVWISLRTTDLREALERHPIEVLKLQQEFKTARMAGHAEEPLIEPVELSATDCQRLAAIWKARALEMDMLLYRQGRISPDTAKALKNGYWALDGAYREGLASMSDFSSVAKDVAQTLRKHRLVVKEGSPSYARLCMAFMRAGLEYIEILERRHSGYIGDECPSPESLPLPSVIPPKQASEQAWPTLTELVDYWKGQGDRRPRTVDEALHAFALMQELHPGVKLHAGNVQPDHIVKLKDQRLKEGKAPATVRKQLNLIGAVFSCAVKNRKAPANPSKGITVEIPKRTAKARVPFAVEDLKAIFSTPIYAEGARPRGGAGQASFWLPLLALFSGARMEELAQLLVSDVGEEDGVPFLHITDLPDDEAAPSTTKRLKNEASRRKTPLHPELVRIGFLRYVRSMKDAGEVRLFPKVGTSSGESRQQSANYSKWFGRYLRDVAKVSDRRRTFHSFRHGFKDAARLAGIPKEHHHAMTGHSSSDEGDKYGDEFFPLVPLKRSMDRLAYPGLDLSQLTWAPGVERR